MTDQELLQLEMYLLGQLSQNEKQAFEEKLKKDAELRSAVVQMRATMVAIRQSVLDDKLALLKSMVVNFFIFWVFCG